MNTGVMMAETIKGIQDAGVIACAKHYILNEQEHFRLLGEAKGYGYNITASASSNVDDRTMHELYLWYDYLLPRYLSGEIYQLMFKGHLQTQCAPGLDQSCAPTTKSTTATHAQTVTR